MAELLFYDEVISLVFPPLFIFSEALCWLYSLKKPVGTKEWVLLPSTVSLHPDMQDAISNIVMLARWKT